jgi:sterol desaturase/sphingolipid hydroxylase (fatty acid hydroxylase superfamily)
MMNMLVWNAVFGMGIAYPLWRWRAVARGSETLRWGQLWHLLPYLLLTDVWFYCAHRLMHTKPFYRRFHKMHHRFTAPEAICGVYCHPLEMMVVNAASLMVGPVLMGSHPAIWSLWGLIATFSVTSSHSGYGPGSPVPGAAGQHDRHHEEFNCNFGVALYIGDRLSGSYKPDDDATTPDDAISGRDKQE